MTNGVRYEECIVMRKTPLLIALAAILQSPASQATESNRPRISFVYNTHFSELFCPNEFSDPLRPIQRDWVEEARSRLPEFQSIWDSQAVVLLDAVTRLTGKPFRHLEQTAGLHICASKPSTSFPILIRYRDFLNGPMNHRPFSYATFINYVFHELLHTYVVDILGGSMDLMGTDRSALLDKFKGEPGNVRIHLHLMAIQSVVYSRIARRDLTAADYETVRRLPDYLRAWKIINDPTAAGYVGPEPFLLELRTR